MKEGEPELVIRLPAQTELQDGFLRPYPLRAAPCTASGNLGDEDQCHAGLEAGSRHLRSSLWNRIIAEAWNRLQRSASSGHKMRTESSGPRPNGIAEVPLTDLAREAFHDQMRISGPGKCLFPSDKNSTGHQKSLRTVWRLTLRRAKVSYFRIYDLRSTYATRLIAGGVADEWVTRLLRQVDAKVFKKYSQVKLQMKRDALKKLNRNANEGQPGFDTAWTAPLN
jgi:hypothetical protein